MIAQAYRFRGRRSLLFLLRKGQSKHYGCCKVYSRLSSKPKYRLAVAVSRKVDKRARVRNRIRRRFYESFRLFFQNHPLQIDLVIIIYDKQLADLPATEFQRKLQPVFEALNTKYTSRSKASGTNKA